MPWQCGCRHAVRPPTLPPSSPFPITNLSTRLPKRRCWPPPLFGRPSCFDFVEPHALLLLLVLQVLAEVVTDHWTHITAVELCRIGPPLRCLSVTPARRVSLGPQDLARRASHGLAVLVPPAPLYRIARLAVGSYATVPAWCVVTALVHDTIVGRLLLRVGPSAKAHFNLSVRRRSRPPTCEHYSHELDSGPWLFTPFSFSKSHYLFKYLRIFFKLPKFIETCRNMRKI
jgi:hypothetical protein